MATSENAELEVKIRELKEKFDAARKQLVELRKQRSGEAVRDYELTRKDGSKVQLSELFGENEDLILVHNMGKSCVYCTLWADGFNGVTDHLENRASFALVSDDDFRTMKAFTEERGWRFTCLSGAESDFTDDMGYRKNGKPHPGVSTFHKDSSGQITRVAHTWFGPGDDFCAVWHFLDMLKDGANHWSPKYSY